MSIFPPGQPGVEGTVVDTQQKFCIYKSMTSRFYGFDWDSGNWPKCNKHGVSREEIEELFHSPLKEADDPCPTEQRKRAVGKTPLGRYIFIVFTYRIKDDKLLIRPISARYMHQKEVENYEKTVA